MRGVFASAWNRRGKCVGLKSLDIRKGDNARPNYRSRLVGREFNIHRDDSLYASTPPLEALRMVISYVATPGEKDSTDGKEIMVNDVSRA